MVKEEEGLSLAIVVHKRVENAFPREKLMALLFPCSNGSTTTKWVQ
jgi:hypothetical protein